MHYVGLSQSRAAAAHILAAVRVRMEGQLIPSFVAWAEARLETLVDPDLSAALQELYGTTTLPSFLQALAEQGPLRGQALCDAMHLCVCGCGRHAHCPPLIHTYTHTAPMFQAWNQLAQDGPLPAEELSREPEARAVD